MSEVQIETLSWDKSEQWFLDHVPGNLRVLQMCLSCSPESQGESLLGFESPFKSEHSHIFLFFIYLVYLQKDFTRGWK